MKDFARFIPVQDGLTAQFVFTTLHSISGSRYFVTVIGVDEQSYMFTMKPRDAKSWKIVDAPKLPEWIMAMESRLEGAILENMHA
jgi:hypothetical protein